MAAVAGEMLCYVLEGGVGWGGPEGRTVLGWLCRSGLRQPHVHGNTLRRKTWFGERRFRLEMKTGSILFQLESGSSRLKFRDLKSATSRRWFVLVLDDIFGSFTWWRT
jgi:hypothetical protein